MTKNMRAYKEAREAVEAFFFSPDQPLDLADLFEPRISCPASFLRLDRDLRQLFKEGLEAPASLVQVVMYQLKGYITVLEDPDRVNPLELTTLGGRGRFLMQTYAMALMLAQTEYAAGLDEEPEPLPEPLSEPPVPASSHEHPIFFQPIISIKDAKALLKYLYYHQLLFHCEDDPADIYVGDRPIFQPDEAEALRLRMAEAYQQDWGDGICPCGYALRLDPEYGERLLKDQEEEWMQRVGELQASHQDIVEGLQEGRQYLEEAVSDLQAKEHVRTFMEARAVRRKMDGAVRRVRNSLRLFNARRKSRRRRILLIAGLLVGVGALAVLLRKEGDP